MPNPQLVTVVTLRIYAVSQHKSYMFLFHYHSFSTYFSKKS